MTNSDKAALETGRLCAFSGTRTGYVTNRSPYAPFQRTGAMTGRGRGERMDRKTLVSGLKACGSIERRIAQKRALARESGEFERYEREIEALSGIRRDMTRCIGDLSELECAAVWEHFVTGDTWERVAMRHYYSERQMRNIGARGLGKLGAAFDRLPAIAAFCEAHRND